VKILLRSTLGPYSGWGRDGIGLALALLARGHVVRLAPLGVGAPLPREVASLLIDPVDGQFDVALHHTECEKTYLSPGDAAAARVNVLWTMWNWPRFPDEEWVADLPDAVSTFDHLVVYDPLSVEAFEEILPAEHAPLHLLLGGYTAADWNTDKTEREPGQPFRFGMNGRLTIRKGYLEAYRAFILLKERHGDAFNAELVLRSVDHVFPPAFRLFDGVRTILSRATPDQLAPWYRSLDTLLAPSSAEGKHLPPIEALTLGVPVIASDIPGHRLWATSDMVTWIPAPTRTIQPGFDGGVIAVSDLADAMWQHYTEPAEPLRKAQIAARTLPAMLDWTKCVERLGHKIGLPL
jgi:glycosyltransferase involved in cell wall biosynthesis